MDADRSKQLQDFVTYAKRLKGDEKGEAQVFLDRLFRAFSRDGYKEAGATLEDRVKKEGGTTGFADLVWRGVVLIEMKKRGEDLSRHLLQAFKYWEELVPGRPRYVVLCNFDEFWIYDFEQDIHQPQDKIALADLPNRYGPLNFLWPTNERPLFRIDRDKVTREAADLLAGVYRKVKQRKGVTPELAQRFVLQVLVCLFSEDIGLLPKHFFTQLLEDCIDPPKAFDLFRGLFDAMNSRSKAHGGRFKGVDYFNGGIFSQSAAMELSPSDEIAMLKVAASFNWAEVSPDIFGTIFQHSMEAKERHAMGAHYTSQLDIMKIVGPTIVQPFSAAIERAASVKELTAIRDRLTTLRVLDPACGSGNFLYIAYREMRRLEAFIIIRQSELSKRDVAGQAAFAAVSPRQFFGMDVLAFAVELAKVTLSLAPKLASDELHTAEKTLPLDNLDTNVFVRDALIDDNGARAVWPAADVIIGNPPFLGAKRLKPERGAKYVNDVRKAYSDVPGMADYCVYWFRRTHDHLPVATPADPFAGRAGLVGTQNIRNNQSRVGGLDHIAKSGVIVEAVENQPWSGEANVHVSIANWVKTAASSPQPDGLPASGRGLPRGGSTGKKPRSPRDPERDNVSPVSINEPALLIPTPRRLWSRVDPALALLDEENPSPNPKVVTTGKRGRVRQDKSYEMEVRAADEINSALSDQTDLSSKRTLLCNTSPKRCFQGKIPGYGGFLVDKQVARRLRVDSAAVIRPYLTGRELLDEFSVDRWIIDFGKRDMLQSYAFASAFEHVKKWVLPVVQRTLHHAKREGSDMVKAREEHLDRWWQLWNRRDELSAWLAKHKRFAACSRVTRRPIVVFLCKSICPSDLIQCFAFEDDYSYGVLQSATHFELFRRSSRMKVESDLRYSSRSVFESLPWPQTPAKKQVKKVAAAAVHLRVTRDRMEQRLGGGLRALYRTLELPGKNPLKDAHAALDAAVLDAYGFDPRRDLLKQLFDLNLAVAKRIDNGEPVTAPGVPPSYGDPADLITDDCIRP